MTRLENGKQSNIETGWIGSSFSHNSATRTPLAEKEAITKSVLRQLNNPRSGRKMSKKHTGVWFQDELPNHA